MEITATIKLSRAGVEEIQIQRPNGGELTFKAIERLLVDLSDLDFLMRVRASGPRRRQTSPHEAKHREAR